MHDLIVDELYDKKSIAAFIWLISHGRELEMSYEGQSFFITSDGSKDNVSMWIDKKEYSFTSVEDMLQLGEIMEHKLIDIWNDIKLGTLF